MKSGTVHFLTECMLIVANTVELQWLKHLWDHENMFETGVVRDSECLS